MKEEFLQFVWQFLHFDVKDLSLASGEQLQIIKQGNYQHNAGPDFENCEIKIDDVSFHGNIEIHIKSSNWNLHKHQNDKAFNNVILHVVWEHDLEVRNSNGHLLPVFSLKDRITQGLENRYEKLIESRHEILCKERITDVSSLKKREMIDKALGKRLELKSQIVLDRLASNKGDWEETAYQQLLQNFGFKINNAPFLQLAENLPYKILKKHLDQPLQIESLLYGQAGFLADVSGSYGESLNKEYQFLASKYQLSDKKLSRHEWKFMRLRPANFATVRLAQLSKLITTVNNLFSFLITDYSSADFNKKISVSVSDYWQRHYDFEKLYKTESNIQLGSGSAENIIINTVVPLLVAYSNHLNDQSYTDRALNLLEQIKSEDNKIIRLWRDLKVDSKNAFDSQGLIMQYNEYCLPKKCLQCSLGISILNQ